MSALSSSLAHRGPWGILSYNDIDDDGGEAPQRISLVIVGDDNSDYRAPKRRRSA